MRWKAITAAALVLATQAQAAEKKYGLGASDTEVKLGQTSPFSGAASAYSVIAKTQAAYFKMINDRGGVNGRKINLITLDDGYSPSKTVEQTRKLVEQDEVLAIFSAVGTAPNISVQKYLNIKKVPQLFVSSGATRWNDPKQFPWTVGFNPTYELEGRLYAKYILKTKPDAKIAVITPNEDAGKDYLRGFKDGLGEHVGQIVAETTYLTTDPTIDSQMVTMRESGADVFFAEATPKFAAQALRKAASMGWKPLTILPTVSNSVSAVLEPAGLEAGLLQHPCDQLGETRLPKLGRRKVDREPQARPGARPRTGRAQHPFAERQDQAGLLGQRNEARRRNLAPLGVAPAQQRLDPDHPHADEVDLRLIVEVELSVREAAAKVVLERPALAQAQVHLFLEEAERAAPFGLRPIERQVRVLQELPRIAAIGEGDADAGPHQDLLAIQIDRLRQERHNATRQRLGRVQSDLAGPKDGELVAAQPCQGVGAPDAALEALRHPTEQKIAGGMAQRVVDVLEAVEVEAQDRRWPVASPPAGEHALEPVLEQHTVGQSGQRVVAREERHVLERSPQCPQRQDPEHHEHAARQAACDHGHGDRVVQERAQGAMHLDLAHLPARIVDGNGAGQHGPGKRALHIRVLADHLAGIVEHASDFRFARCLRLREQLLEPVRLEHPVVRVLAHPLRDHVAMIGGLGLDRACMALEAEMIEAEGQHQGHQRRRRRGGDRRGARDLAVDDAGLHEHAALL